MMGLFRAPSSVERDVEYYIDRADAECVIRVDNTLFKVHEQLLYASVPISDFCKSYGKTSDYRPLRLIATSADDFRILLWTLYTHPSQRTRAADYTHEDINRMLSLASVTQTYQFTDLHKWSYAMLLDAVKNNEGLVSSCSSATLSRIADVAVGCRFDNITTAIEKKWSERVAKNDTPSVPAMIAADKHGLKELRGISYYVHILDMLDRQAHGATKLRVDSKLNNEQIMRVLSGYWSLVNFWEQFRQTPLNIPCGKGCSPNTHDACVANWERRWSSAIGWKRILGYNSADILALLACLREELQGDEELRLGMHPSCRLMGLETLKMKLEDSRAGLNIHFSD